MRCQSKSVGVGVLGWFSCVGCGVRPGRTLAAIGILCFLGNLRALDIPDCMFRMRVLLEQLCWHCTHRCSTMISAILQRRFFNAERSRSRIQGFAVLFNISRDSWRVGVCNDEAFPGLQFDGVACVGEQGYSRFGDVGDGAGIDVNSFW